MNTLRLTRLIACLGSVVALTACSPDASFSRKVTGTIAPQEDTSAPEAPTTGSPETRGPASETPPEASPSATPSAPATPPAVTQTPSPEVATEAMYAHSDRTLFAVEAGTLTVKSIGDFTIDGAPANRFMTDIAISKDGILYGIDGSGVIYRINASTAAMTAVGQLPAFVNGLAISTDGILYAAGFSVIFTFDTRDGTVGRFNQDATYSSSGDLIALPDGYLYQTAIGPNGADLLIRIDPRTGATREVGSTGVSGMWGLGYAQGTLYGFDSTGRILSVSSATGASPVVVSTSFSFYGATTNPLAW
jgi:hypothetical protein